MAVLESGRYTITNAKFFNLVVLPDANDDSDLVARVVENVEGEKWDITLLSNKRYTIKNCGHSNFAACCIRPEEGDYVCGKRRNQQWIIKETRIKGQYIISPTDNVDLFWGLQDGEIDTPITLDSVPNNPKNQWIFTDQTAQIGMGEIDPQVTPNETSQLSNEDNSRNTFPLREITGHDRHGQPVSLPDEASTARPAGDGNTTSPTKELEQFKEKKLTIYHSPDDVNRQLRAPVKILFILTPKHDDESDALYSPVAWKILDFPHYKALDSKTLVLHKDFGFALINQDEAGIVQVTSQSLSVIVPCGHRAVLENRDDVLEWTVDHNSTQSSGDFIGVSNNTDIPVSLALCMIDNSNPDAPKCFPIAALGELESEETIRCPAPVFLHAFASSKHREGQIVKLSDFKNTVFKSEKPFNILGSELPEKSVHRLYSQATGRNVLEMAIKGV